MDAAAYAAMKNTMGEIFKDVIETFLDYVPQQITNLGTAIEQADSDSIFNFAHAIKSSSSSIGALGLAKSAAHIELLGRDHNNDGIELHYQTLQAQFSEAAAFLKQDLMV